MTTVERADGTRGNLTADEVRKLTDTSQWFNANLKVPVPFQELLQSYSKVPSDEITQHVTIVRQEAFDAYPYPCIGELRFLELLAAQHFAYPQVLSRLTEGQTYIDVGTCFGQDIRKLIYDGVPNTPKLNGLDIEPAFFGCGKKLFRDGGDVSGVKPLEAHFYTADLTKPGLPEDLTAGLGGKTDVIGVMSVFHLFTLENQKAFARNLVALSKPGSLIFGRQLGAENPREFWGLHKGTSAFGHNIESWTALWDEVGKETGTKWKVEGSTAPPSEGIKKQTWCEDDMNYISFAVTRV